MDSMGTDLSVVCKETDEKQLINFGFHIDRGFYSVRNAVYYSLTNLLIKLKFASQD